MTPVLSRPLQNVLASVPVAALTLLVMGSGCATEETDPIVLSVTWPAGTQATRLEVWMKREGRALGTERRVMTPEGEGQAVEVGLGRDLATEPFLLGLKPTAGQASGGLYVHVVAKAGTRPTAVGDARVVFGDGAPSVPLALATWSAACDRDGDTFLNCTLAGCCDHVQADVRDRFADCLDDPAIVDGFRGDAQCRQVEGSSEDLARGTHPFRPSSFGHNIDRCDDCIDQDCAGGDEVCDFADGDGDGVSPPYDCDDDDPARAPGLAESCNVKDDDCDGEVDEGFDQDGDGVAICGGDCDDTDPTIHPGAEPICGDGVDQTCGVEPGPDVEFEDACPDADLDGDGWPAPPGGTDCDDRNAGVYPQARERCGDEIDQDCQDGDLPCAITDGDGDGHGDKAQGGLDCDDNDRRTYPGAADKCGDGKDQNCDGVDLDCAAGVDGDGDSYLAGEGDCDDGDSTVFPWTAERCNGQDDDCDGEVDEGNPLSLRGEAARAEDCYDGPAPTRDVGECESGKLTCTRIGGSPGLLCHGQRLPKVETCLNEAVDDDCTGVNDDITGRNDACDTGELGTCAAGAMGCAEGELVCVRTAPPGADVACDGLDIDCDGTGDADEFLEGWHTRACFTGAGEAGVGICRAGTQSCTGAAYGACAGETNARDETCTNAGADDECDGATDNVPGLNDPCDTGVPGLCAAGRRQCQGANLGCAQPVQPANDEICDGFDNNCNGSTDEAFPRQNEACDAPNRPEGRCRQGQWKCRNSREICDPLIKDAPNADATCDGADDDCDGRIDEDWGGAAQCQTGEAGRCAAGRERCFGGQGSRCVRRNDPINEICNNGQDDDCDGLADALDVIDCPPPGEGEGEGEG